MSDEADKLAEELRGLAIEMHRRCYSHVPQWKPSETPRGILSQIDNMVAGMMSDIQRLRAAISWVEPPFVDEATPEAELRFRIEQVVKDAKAASAMSAGTAETRSGSGPQDRQRGGEAETP